MVKLPELDEATKERILSLYAQNHSKAETARQVGVHMNTVHKVVKVHEHRCASCGEELTPYDRFIRCQKCRARATANAKVYRANRVRRGVCAMCDSPVDPPSRQYCAHHRMQQILANERYDQKKRDNRMSAHGTPNVEQRERYVRHSYGLDALLVWREMDGICQICGVKHEQRAVHIHHIDKNRANSTRENLTCLCQRCHRFVHLLAEHEMPAQAIEWVRKTYPALGL